MRTAIPFILIICLIAIPLYFENNPSIVRTAQEFKSSGVSVFYSKHGGGKKPADELERIVNNNKFPVIVRCVWQFHGESTEWVKKLNPDESMSFDVSHQHGFYILNSTKNQKTIGFINIH